MLDFFFQHCVTYWGFVLRPKRVLSHITLGIIDHNTHRLVYCLPSPVEVSVGFPLVVRGYFVCCW